MSDYIPLSDWWKREDDDVVAFSRGNAVTAATFKCRVAAWVATLATKQGDRWAVYHIDAVEFLAILCALWQLSRTACIASDNLPATEARMTPQVDGFVGQFNSAKALQGAGELVPDSVDWLAIPDAHVAIEVYTSGSTGEPKAIKKHMSDLVAEHVALASLLPNRLPEMVISTVTHHHLYGLTFRLFRPFSSGLAFPATTCEYLEDVIQEAQHCHSFSLISSPSHLGRFNQALDWEAIKDKCVDVYSSAAALKLSHSRVVAKCLAAPVIEIYGSTETGAIAWRQQHDDGRDALWQPLNHVQLSALENQTLQVVFHQNKQVAEVLADNVSFAANGHFSLHGRADQITKVEGKRLSLVALENVLLQHDWVAEAKALVLKRQREEVAVVLTLTDTGGKQLLAIGRKSFIQTLKSILSDHFETVLLPRRWRFVDQLPYNSQGKLAQQALIALFAPQKTEWPEIVSSEQQGESLVLHCRLPANLRYFEGHFDEQGLLPGVVQVHWAANFGKQHFKYKGCFTHIEAVKFQKVLLPEDSFYLMLSYDKDKQKLLFEYESKKGVHSSGRICYA